MRNSTAQQRVKPPTANTPPTTRSQSRTRTHTHARDATKAEERETRNTTRKEGGLSTLHYAPVTQDADERTSDLDHHLLNVLPVHQTQQVGIPTRSGTPQSSPSKSRLQPELKRTCTVPFVPVCVECNIHTARTPARLLASAPLFPS